MQPMRIKAVHFKPDRGQNEVWATLDNGEGKFLFRYFTDEIAFSENELVGLTVDEAVALHTKKDVAYLRS